MVFALTAYESKAQYYSANDSVMIGTINSSISNWGRGFEFVPNVDIYISKLGKRVPASANFFWKIWDVNAQTLVYQQTSAVNNPTFWVYEPTDSVIKLNAGTKYALTLYGDNSGYYYGSSTVLNSNLSYGGTSLTMRYCNNCYSSGSFPTQTLTGMHYGTSDFIFSLCYPIDNSTTVNLTTITASQTGASYQWLDCNNGYAVIAGATNQSFTANMNGSYACEITMNGCTDTTNCVTINSVGVDEDLINNQITVYPNPANDQLTISTGNLTGTKEFYLTSLDGKLVSSGVINTNQSNYTLDLSAISKGVYLLKVISNKTPVFKKIVKE
ncbi:MAG: hypothetical protein Kow0079_05710 [Vicingaceae bacterium]